MAASVEIGERPSSPEDAVYQHRSRPSSPPIFGVSNSTGNVRRHSEGERNAPAGTPLSPRAVVSEGEARPYGDASSIPIGYLANRWFAEDSFSSTSSADRPGENSFSREWDSRPIIGPGIQLSNSRLNSFSSTSSAADRSPPVLQPHSASSSQVRLSLSLDGKAELVSALQSPPRPAPQLSSNAETLPPVFGNRTLQRSRSAVSSVTLPPISTLTKNLGTHFPSLGRGRSHDVHAWESCCEADTRDELTRQAENESSGSAIAAISLMRSSSSSASLSNLIHNHHSHPQPPSHTGILQPNPGKRNTFNTTRGLLDRKPKLARAKTSPPMARYMSVEESKKVIEAEEEEDLLEPEKKKRKKQGNELDILSPGDSDKENWSPDEEGNQDRRRPLPPPEAGASPTKAAAPVPRNPRRVGRILGEQDAVTKRLFMNGSMDMKNRTLSRASTAPTQGQRLRKLGDGTVAIFEDEEITAHDEKSEMLAREEKRPGDVHRFMREELSPSKRPDMDCVAGLLSLSQGNWR